jgi:hypothetical protein
VALNLKKLIILIAGCVALQYSCSRVGNFSAPADSSPQNPLHPRTGSILPLAEGNRWTYSFSDYDSTGVRQSNREELNLSMEKVFGLTPDSHVVNITYSNAADSCIEYYYTYEWEDVNEGSLVTYRDIRTTPGLYIVGAFQRDSVTLYPAPALWLRYPADSGMQWDLILPDTGAAIDTIHMELLSTHAPFYYPGSAGVTGGRFYACYLYKETAGASVSYYYYHKEFGAIAFLRYENGVLRKTYVLHDFQIR